VRLVSLTRKPKCPKACNNFSRMGFYFDMVDHNSGAWGLSSEIFQPVLLTVNVSIYSMCVYLPNLELLRLIKLGQISVPI